MFYRVLVRPLLFALPAETAQGLAEASLRATALWRAASVFFDAGSPRLRTELCGIPLSSPIGLAAGFDKDLRILPALAALGFGYLTGGTVTLDARPGNRRPRLARDPARQALTNSLGFPGSGSEAAVGRVRRIRESLKAGLVISVAGTEIDDVVACHRRVEPHAAAVEVNISSPNTAGLRAFHEAPALAELLAAVGEGVGRNGRRPLFVKLPPYPDSEEGRRGAMALVRACADAGVGAVTIANSRPVQDARLAVGSGGLSGRPLFADTLRMVRETRSEVGDLMAVNACGGIFSGDDAYEALRAGATTVQIYTALVYRGPAAVGAIKRELLRRMDDEGVPDVPSLRDGHRPSTGSGRTDLSGHLPSDEA